MNHQFPQALACLLALSCVTPATSQVVIQGKRVYASRGTVIEDGMIVIRDGKIAAVGRAADLNVPKDYEVLQAEVVTPGLIDSHCTVGLSGILNVPHDQDQLENSAPLQPELRALDAYNAHDELVSWVRGFGVTTIHTGHAPGELISGQTLVVKTVGNTVESAKLMDTCAVVVSLTNDARKTGGKSPGTRGKMMAMLRTELIKTREYQQQVKAAAEQEDGTPPPRDLHLETLAKVLDGELPLMVTAQKAQDISNALRLADEFQFRLWLDGAAEAYLLTDQIKAANVPVFVHPTMARPDGDLENLSFETAGKLAKARIPIALQAGYESYVPKTRVVLFEAGLAAAHGLSFEQALGAITWDAAAILGVDDRVGALEIGKDGDVALFDGDPFEYTSHCVGVVIDGQVVSRDVR
ncbi:MAG: amidohydrolase family protein [Planctomycetales bacterium]|nr:amidohydrolase family protein [Planctomycetales bacterium]